MAKKSNNAGEKLDRYRDKRDPTTTNEPFGPGPAVRDAVTRQGEFVCHLHDATRRHWDLRIEMGGVLQSFAVPRGPSLNPQHKRLAVHTEEHPLGYLDFEAVIPAGNYGAGAMIAWDRGRVRYLDGTGEDGVARGKIDFELYGSKLRGRFALVKIGGRRPADLESQRAQEEAQWLLIKKTDPYASAELDLIATRPRSVLSGLTFEELYRKDEVAAAIEARAEALGATRGRVEARRVKPMLCTNEGPGLAVEGWVYELKLDGVRIVADKRGQDVALFYRTGRPATGAFPEIVRAVRSLAPERAVLDGEIVAFDDEGKPSFEKLARRIHARRPGDLRFAMRAVPVQYLVFDCLAVGPWDLRDLPLLERKELLARIAPGRGAVRTLDHLSDDGTALYELCKSQGLEGVVGKRGDSRYLAGPKRSGHWVKNKCEREDELVVVGYTAGENSRARLGAVDIASWEGERLIVRGKVGSGLSDAAIDQLLALLEPLVVDESAAEGDFEPAPRGRTFVRPEIVVSVRYLGWGDNGRLRFPVFRGVRHDIDPRQPDARPRALEDAVDALPSDAEQARERERVVGRAKLSNQNKVFWPREGFTKGDLCGYYEAIAPVLLPHLAERPVSLVRYPDGIEGKSFYQWRIPQGAPSWLRVLPLRLEERDGKEVNTILVDDVDSLLYIANLGCIPIHVIAARAGSLEMCDFLTIDFDLGGRPLRDAIPLARTLRELCDGVGLPSYPKTSGRTGLHVHIPVGPRVPFPAAKQLLELLGRLVVTRHPEVATMLRMKNRRGGKIYVDTGQTGRSRTIVAPYSVRAHPGATVATPLDWDEVGYALDPRTLSIFTVPERMAEHDDPLGPMHEDAPDLAAVMERLAPIVEELS